MTKISLSLGPKGRSCGDCTKCCEGWLRAEIKGEEMYPGKPCQFVTPGVGCSIYKNRPKEPCKLFECSWKASDFVPEQFSPKNTGQILCTQRVENIDYLCSVYAGKEIEPEYLSWLVGFAVARQLNVEWFVNGLSYALGSPDFLQARERRNIQHAQKMQELDQGLPK